MVAQENILIEIEKIVDILPKKKTVFEEPQILIKIGAWGGRSWIITAISPNPHQKWLNIYYKNHEGDKENKVDFLDFNEETYEELLKLIKTQMLPVEPEFIYGMKIGGRFVKPGDKLEVTEILNGGTELAHLLRTKKADKVILDITKHHKYNSLVIIPELYLNEKRLTVGEVFGWVGEQAETEEANKFYDWEFDITPKFATELEVSDAVFLN